MRLLRKLLVLIFVRRKARAHAQAVLERRVRPADTLAPKKAAGKGTAPNMREQLIADALAVRKSREAEWNALTPAQRSRAVAALGDGMEAIVKTFGAA